MLHLVGLFSLHTLLTMHGHRNLKTFWRLPHKLCVHIKRTLVRVPYKTQSMSTRVNRYCENCVKCLLYTLYGQTAEFLSATVFGTDIKYRYIANILCDTKINQYPSGTLRNTKGRTRIRLHVLSLWSVRQESWKKLSNFSPTETHNRQDYYSWLDHYLKAQ